MGNKTQCLSVFVLVLVLLLVSGFVSASSSDGVWVAGGESPIWNQLADGVWAEQDLWDNHQRDLGLPNNGRGWKVIHVASNTDQCAWHIGLKDIQFIGNLQLPQCVSLTMRGGVKFTVVGTNEQYRIFGADARPALSFSGSGYLKLKDLTNGQSACFVLGTGKIPVPTEVSRPIQIEVSGFAQADLGDTKDTSQVDVRWLYNRIDAPNCSF